MHENFVTDMVQGGAGTSVNMNANEVIANRACEIMGHKKGEFQYCSPNANLFSELLLSEMMPCP